MNRDKLVYKLTDSAGRTRNDTQWGENVTHEVPLINRNTRADLCTNAWIHFYEDPILGLLMNPCDANFINPLCFTAKIGEGATKREALKCGAQKLTTVAKIETPIITKTQRIRFAVLCALAVCKDKKFVLWANNWLNNIDRTAASAAYSAAAAYAAYYAAASAAYYAADYAASAAYAYAAYAAYYAAACAENINTHIDFIAIAHEAMKGE
jgi:hypothetical protein